MFVKPIVDAIAHLDADGGVDEVGRSDLYGRRTGHEELDGILGVHDTSEPDDRYAHGLCHLPEHSDRDRLDGWSAESSSLDAEQRPSAFDVNGHAHEGVDERDAVGPLVLHCLCDIGDIGDVG